MINTINTIFNKTKLFLLILLMLVFTSCGSFNSSGFTSNDGIYTKNKSNVDNNSNTNGLYYKDYFDQKAQEYGLNTEANDSKNVGEVSKSLFGVTWKPKNNISFKM